jgi:hypothetical protein
MDCIDSLGYARGAVHVCLFVALLFPNLAFRLMPILTSLVIPAALLFV